MKRINVGIVTVLECWKPPVNRGQKVISEIEAGFKIQTGYLGLAINPNGDINMNFFYRQCNM